MNETRIIIEDLFWCDSYWEAPCPYGCGDKTILIMDNIHEHPDYDDVFVYHCFGCGKPVIFERLKNRGELTVRLSCRRPPKPKRRLMGKTSKPSKKPIPFSCPKCGTLMERVNDSEWVCHICPYHYKRDKPCGSKE
jgi:hypothetical protein